MKLPRAPWLRRLVLAVIPPGVFNDVAQAGHFQAGLLAVFAPELLIGQGWRYVGAGVIVAFAAGKEFWYDHLYESEPVRGSDLEDFSFYVAGTIVALGACWWRLGWWIGIIWP